MAQPAGGTSAAAKIHGQADQSLEIEHDGPTSAPADEGTTKRSEVEED